MRRVLILMVVLMAFAFAVALVEAPNAEAASFSISNNYEFSGGTNPCGSAPWGTATFADQSAGTVRLTMALSIGKAGCTAEFATGWYFNLDPALNPTNLAFSYISGQAATDGIATGANAYQADGDGKFDIQFSWTSANNANRFTGSETAVYDITCALCAGFDALDFDFTSFTGGGQGVYRSALRVLATGGVGGSAWIGDKDGPGPSDIVPEPGTMTMFGIALAGVLAAARVWKREVA